MLSNEAHNIKPALASLLVHKLIRSEPHVTGELSFMVLNALLALWLSSHRYMVRELVKLGFGPMY